LRIQVSPEKLVSKNIKHYITKVGMDEKRHLLLNFCNANPEAKAIVFARTQVRVDRVLAHLKKNQVEAFTIHGGMAQEERERNLEAFRNLSSGLLIATDVSARGIDLPGITHVLNYDIPDDPENYVHRVGRTGRGFAKGEAVSFCSPEEKAKLEQIEEFIQTKIPELKIDKHMLKEASVPKDDSQSIAEMLEIEEALFLKPKKQIKSKKKR
jgi:ATP-dependent RNA helicase RhlE